MADNYSQGTVDPEIKKSDLKPEDLEKISEYISVEEYDRDGETYLYLFSEEYGDWDELSEVLKNCLKYLPIDYFTIQIANTCSKMRHGEFGGCALFITKEEIKYCDIWDWLMEQEKDFLENVIK
uniref:Uncharacterized protein n=1 Tax=viral metagenome TaxID=1070528 RepID=A0A6M3LRZ7_9ZZZZ